MSKGYYRVLWCISLLLVFSGSSLAVPRPSWDYEAISQSPAPSDPQAYLAKVEDIHTVSGETQSLFLDRYRTEARFDSPACTWAWLQADAKLRGADARVVLVQWRILQVTLQRSLVFRVHVQSTRGPQALKSLYGNKATATLVDDLGRTYAPSEQNIVTVPEEDGLPTANGIIYFPRVDDAGRSIIADTTKYVDLILPVEGGRALFHFTFE